MVEHACAVRQIKFMKVIHVKLAHEGGKAIVPKVSWEQILFQLLLVKYPDSALVNIPSDGLGIFLRLG